MAYLRFDPHDYDTLSRLCRSHDLASQSLPAFRRLLLLALADLCPRLAKDIATLDRQRLHLLYSHCRAQPHNEREHGLTGAEIDVVKAAGVPLLSCARFARLLKRALVRTLAELDGALAAKIERLSLGQFAGLGKEVQVRGREKP